MHIRSLFYRIIVPLAAAVFISLSCAAIPILGPLPQPPMPVPTDTRQPSDTPAPTRTPQTPTLTPTLTLTRTHTITASPTVTLKPTRTASPRPNPTSSNPVQICFFAVGLGDAILIIAPDGETMLVDGGSEDSGILGYLHSLGIRKIDVMVATHPHQDHIGGLVDVLNAMPVRQLYTNGQSLSNDSTYADFLQVLASSGVKTTRVVRRDKIHLGELTLDVLNPQASARSDTNENSMVLRFSFRKTTVLLMGDADQNSESSILAAGLPVEADILKMGHHGAATSSSEDFLEAVSPEVAIYSSGYGNSFGLPEKAALDRVRRLGSQIYGTDKNGSIFVTIGSNGYKVVVSKGE